MSSKYRTAAEYEPAMADECETALVILLQAFATLKNTVRLVGGLVPRYLTPADEPGVPVHVGTNDVDVVLDVALIDAGEGYIKLRNQLKDAGFARYQPPHGPPSSWQWTLEIRGKMVLVEFLQEAPVPDTGHRIAKIDGEEVGACKIPHVGIAQQWFEERVVQVELPDGNGITTETIRHADVVAFIVLKALATHSRSERKDPADLVHVMRHFFGGVDRIVELFAERWASGEHRDALVKCLHALWDRFCDHDEVEGYRMAGPAAVARFYGLPDGSDEAINEQRNVSGLVNYFLDRLAERGIHA